MSRRRSYKQLLLTLEVGIAIIIPVLIGVVCTYVQLQEIMTLKRQANYEECINKAETDIQASIFSKQAQELLNECLMGYAQKLAAEGKFPEAIAAAKNISKNSPLYPEVQKRIKEWNEI